MTLTPEVTIPRVRVSPENASSVAPAVTVNSLRTQVFRFLLIGGTLALGYLGVYQLFLGAGTQTANLVALSSTTLASIWLNRKFTFNSKERFIRDWTQSLVVFLVALGLTSGALHLAPNLPLFEHLPSALVGLGANLSVTLLRFFMLRHWVYRHLK